jgi:hypothetical protein
VETRQLAESGSRTPGEMLVVGTHVWEACIAEGVQQGLFGLGELDESDRPRCLYFKEQTTPSLQGREVLIRDEICVQQKAQTVPGGGYPPAAPSAGGWSVVETRATLAPDQEQGAAPPPPTADLQADHSELQLRFTLPLGQASNLLGLLNLLQARFRNLQITIQASDGSITDAEVEDKVREAFRQMDIDAEIHFHLRVPSIPQGS